MSSAEPSDYSALAREAPKRVLEGIDRWGALFFKEQYSDPAHFLLELLQNAEDALGRRRDRPPMVERSVKFCLTEDALRVSYFGDPFNSDDVESICDIANSTKPAEERIGRFGIGFKSVYRFTDRPEIHSGSEDFAIVNYVYPETADQIPRAAGETVILIPKTQGHDHWATLQAGLGKMLCPANLLFLRHIESVRWSATDGSSAEHLRQSEDVSPGIRRVTILGGPRGHTQFVEEQWLIFSQAARADDGRAAGRVEIAFRIDLSQTTRELPICRLPKSLLYAYFPTDKETHLGFLIQGPYNTTPARDNVMALDPWNVRLVSETASLLRRALSWFRDRGEITVDLLNCLPLDESQFTETMFLPLFEETKRALYEDGLLPADWGGYVRASCAKLGRGKELRGLFTRSELAELCNTAGEMEWLSGEITQDREGVRDLYWYLRRDLEVQELTPESVVQRLTGEFLNRRSDEWVLRFYEFLADQSGSGLRDSLMKKPILRLDDGQHVRPPREDDRGVFFPGEATIGFRMVRQSVCQGEKARRFLESLRVREPDLVADVIENVLPKYGTGKPQISSPEYRVDLDRIARANATDSRESRSRLLSKLKGTRWVRAVDGAGEDAGWRSPEEVYLPTPVLRPLFDGVASMCFPDLSWVRSELLEAGKLLEQCGAASYLRRVKAASKRQDVMDIIHEAGARWRNPSVEDWDLEGVQVLLGVLPKLVPEARADRSRNLWDALCEAWRREAAEDNDSVWSGRVRWRFHEWHSRRFDAAFVKVLRETEWVADTAGVLRRPSEVALSSLGWPDEPALRTRLDFLSGEDERRREESEILTELARLGISSLRDLRLQFAASPLEAELLETEDEWVDIVASGRAGGPEAKDFNTVVNWWLSESEEERDKYRTRVYPGFLDVRSLRDSTRLEWFTMFALACFRSYGRTRDEQHRSFVETGVRGGWWQDLAKSKPPKDVNAWLERLNAWSGANQPSQEFRMWRGSFLALYTVARWLDEYILLMRKLPDIVEEEGPLALRDVLDPTYSPAARKLGLDAAPLARTLGIGVNWIIRELIRGGVYERAGVMVPYAWMASGRVREFLAQAGGPALDGANPDHSRRIYNFAVQEVGKEAAEFDGDYDLPLQLWTMRGRN